MGYYSDVAYRIGTADPKNLLDRFLAENPQHKTELSISGLVVDEDDLTYQISGVKWYEGYPAVAAHEALWEFARILERNGEDIICGRWCRVGEDLDDTEFRSFGEDWNLPGPYITRVIDMD